MPSSCHEQIDSVLTQSDHRTIVTESHQKHRIYKQTARIEHWKLLNLISAADELWYMASGNNEFGNWHSIYPFTRRTDAILSTFWQPADCQAITYRWLGSFQTASKLDGRDITVIKISLAWFLSATTPCRNRKLPYAQECTGMHRNAPSEESPHLLSDHIILHGRVVIALRRQRSLRSTICNEI
jgi:hypothetical protein